MDEQRRVLARRFAALAGLGAVGAMMLTACSGGQSDDELIDMSIPMNDGTYTGQSNADEQGAVGTVTITVAGGRRRSSPTAPSRTRTTARTAPGR